MKCLHFDFFSLKKKYDLVGRKWRFHSLKKFSVYQALFRSKVSEISTFHLFFVIKGGPSTFGRKKVSLYFLDRIILKKQKKLFTCIWKSLHLTFFRRKKKSAVVGRIWRFHSLKKFSVYQALFISKMSEISIFHLFFYIKGGASTPGRKKVSLYFLGWNLFSTGRKSVILFCQKLLKCNHFEHFLIKTP